MVHKSDNRNHIVNYNAHAKPRPRTGVGNLFWAEEGMKIEIV